MDGKKQDIGASKNVCSNFNAVLNNRPKIIKKLFCCALEEYDVILKYENEHLIRLLDAVLFPENDPSFYGLSRYLIKDFSDFVKSRFFKDFVEDALAKMSMSELGLEKYNLDDYKELLKLFNGNDDSTKIDITSFIEFLDDKVRQLALKSMLISSSKKLEKVLEGQIDILSDSLLGLNIIHMSKEYGIVDLNGVTHFIQVKNVDGYNNLELVSEWHLVGSVYDVMGSIFCEIVDDDGIHGLVSLDKGLLIGGFKSIVGDPLRVYEGFSQNRFDTVFALDMGEKMKFYSTKSSLLLSDSDLNVVHFASNNSTIYGYKDALPTGFNSLLTKFTENDLFNFSVNDKGYLFVVNKDLEGNMNGCYLSDDGIVNEIGKINSTSGLLRSHALNINYLIIDNSKIFDLYSMCYLDLGDYDNISAIQNKEGLNYFTFCKDGKYGICTLYRDQGGELVFNEIVNNENVHCCDTDVYFSGKYFVLSFKDSLQYCSNRIFCLLDKNGKRVSGKYSLKCCDYTFGIGKDGNIELIIISGEDDSNNAFRVIDLNTGKDLISGKNMLIGSGYFVAPGSLKDFIQDGYDGDKLIALKGYKNGDNPYNEMCCYYSFKGGKIIDGNEKKLGLLQSGYDGDVVYMGVSFDDLYYVRSLKDNSLLLSHCRWVNRNWYVGQGNIMSFNTNGKSSTRPSNDVLLPFEDMGGYQGIYSLKQRKIVGGYNKYVKVRENEDENYCNVRFYSEGGIDVTNFLDNSSQESYGFIFHYGKSRFKGEKIIKEIISVDTGEVLCRGKEIVINNNRSGGIEFIVKNGLFSRSDKKIKVSDLLKRIQQAISLKVDVDSGEDN